VARKGKRDKAGVPAPVGGPVDRVALGVGVGPGGRDHAGLDGVALDVTRAGQEVGVGVDHRGLEPALEQGADQAVAAAVLKPGGDEQAGHDRGEAVGAVEVNQEVEVVGHEAVVVDAEGGGGVAGEQFQEVGEVVGVVEGGFAGVAAVEDVEAGVGGVSSAAWSTGHGGLQSRVGEGPRLGFGVGECNRQGPDGKGVGRAWRR